VDHPVNEHFPEGDRHVIAADAMAHGCPFFQKLKPGTQRLYTVDWGERRFGIVAVLLRKLLREVLALLFGVSAVCPVKTFNQAVMLVLKGFSGMISGERKPGECEGSAHLE